MYSSFPSDQSVSCTQGGEWCSTTSCYTFSGHACCKLLASLHMQPISLQYVEVFDVGEDDLASAFCCVVSNVFKQHTALYTLQADSRKSKAS